MPSLTDLNVFSFSWFMSPALVSQGPSRFSPSSPFGSWRYRALGDIGATKPSSRQPFVAGERELASFGGDVGRGQARECHCSVVMLLI